MRRLGQGLDAAGMLANLQQMGRQVNSPSAYQDRFIQVRRGQNQAVSLTGRLQGRRQCAANRVQIPTQ